MGKILYTNKKKKKEREKNKSKSIFILFYTQCIKKKEKEYALVEID